MSATSGGLATHTTAHQATSMASARISTASVPDPQGTVVLITVHGDDHVFHAVDHGISFKQVR